MCWQINYRKFKRSISSVVCSISDKDAGFHAGLLPVDGKCPIDKCTLSHRANKMGQLWYCKRCGYTCSTRLSGEPFDTYIQFKQIYAEQLGISPRSIAGRGVKPPLGRGPL